MPYALGQSINFDTQTGPKLSKFNLNIFLDKNEKEFNKKLDPIYKVI